MTCKFQLCNRNHSVRTVNRDHGYKSSLPSRTNERRLGVVRRVPGADAELEPALCVDREGDRPQTPSVVVLLRQLVRGYSVPDVSAVDRQVP